MPYFLGADLGATKTHLLIANEQGQVVGIGKAGPANQQNIGYEGMSAALSTAFNQALQASAIRRGDISGAAFGIAGYDWPSQYEQMHAIVSRMELDAPLMLCNDAIIGLVAGAEAGWGIVLVSGTGCNCRGWDRAHENEGRVSGYGIMMGEGAGGTELVFHAMQKVNHAWTRRGASTKLCEAFIDYAGASCLEDLIEGYTEGRYHIDAAAAPLIFKVAESGDEVARAAIEWAGCELGELANGVIRQLGFEEFSFDVVLSGSMFAGGALLIDPLRATILKVAPHIRMVRLKVPPAVGAVILAMEAGGLIPTVSIRRNLEGSELLGNLS